MKSIFPFIVICSSVAIFTYGEEGTVNEIISETEKPEDVKSKNEIISETEKPEDVKSKNEIISETEKPEDVNAKNDTHDSRSGNIQDRGRLIKDLFQGYDKRNYPTNVTVKFGIAILSYDIDEAKQTFEADVWLRIVWDDFRFQWDTEYYGSDVIRIPSEEVWVPDVTLYNSADHPEMMKCWPSKVLIYPNGEFLWVPPCHLSAHCNLNLTMDPFGPQKCYMKFGSWTYDGFTMDIVSYNNETKADMSDFHGSSKWDLISNELTRHEKYYSCCPEPYPHLINNLTIQRKVTPISECRV